MEFFTMLMFLLSGITVLFTGVNSEFSTEACKDSGRQLYCDVGQVLNIDDVLCLPYNYTCPEKFKIMSLCNGYRSCTSIGLRRQLWPYCQSQQGRKMEIKYSCVTGRPYLPCRTNICSNESEGLQCSEGDVIHILKLMCSHGATDCPWNIYHILYSMCEGQQICLSSGLRVLGLQSTCDDDFTPTANVIVDFICIKASFTDSTCTGNVRLLAPRFGVISSPDFPHNPHGNPDSCYWAIHLGQGREIGLTVHLSYSREFTSKCTPDFLQVTYTECVTMEQKTDMFCQPSVVNIQRRSCGDVIIRSPAYLPGEDRGNRFLLSYEVNGYHTSKKAYVPYLQPCNSDFTTSNMTSSVPFFSASDRDFQATNSDTEKPRGNYTMDFNSYDPERHILIFKVVVINFFLFVVAFCLVVALIFVCYRYKKLSKHGNYNLTTQSDSESGGGPNVSSTPLQTFSENAADQTEIQTFPNHNRRGNSVYSEDLYATVDKVDDVFNEVGTRHSGVSSFRPKESRNPYASYDSLDFDPPPVKQHQSHHMDNSMSETRTQNYEDLPAPPPDLQNPCGVTGVTGSSDIPHYIINNDEYAIVQKPRKRNPDTQQLIPPSQHKSAPKHSIELTVRHQQLPSSTYRDTSFTSDVGFIPHHNCMLSGTPCNVPPFPSPIRQNGNLNS